MNRQKNLWDGLAKENSKYYINSDYGKGITDEQFVNSGENDYKRLILEDPLIPLDRTILEIGCGNGRMTEFLARDFNVVLATDISSEMIKEAELRLRNCNNIILMETDGESIPIYNKSFDVAFSYLVFQHMKTKEMIEKNFDEVYRLLKPDGIFKVLLRADEVDVNKWWGGVKADETYPLSIGFKLLKKEQIKDYGLWLWLQK